MKAIPFTSAAIIGMGRTGCSVARFLHQFGVACIAFDEHRQTLPDDIPPIPMHTGSLDFARLADSECIVVSPGVPWQHPALEEARAAGIPVIGDLELFADHFDGELLAVTGTNGKTTTVSLIATLLETLPGGIEAAGNIGRPMLDLLLEEYVPDRVVLELSSFQLERCRRIHPRWAALLNVQPDHADMHANAASYTAAKLRLFAHQGKGDTALLPADTRWDELADELAGRGVRIRRFGMCDETQSMAAGLCDGTEGTVLFWTQGNRQHTIPCAELRTLGTHQHLNMAVAAQAAADFGVQPSVTCEALESFRGLPHRMQYLGRTAGKAWYDDSKATNPNAAMAALGSFDRVLWICGGLRKGLDLAPLTRIAKRHVARGFIIGRDTTAFADMLATARVPFDIAGEMHRAVSLAAAYPDALPVLLSPAAASQDQFSDYAERGRCFSDAIACLEPAA